MAAPSDILGGDEFEEITVTHELVRFEDIAFEGIHLTRKVRERKRREGERGDRTMPGKYDPNENSWISCSALNFSSSPRIL